MKLDTIVFADRSSRGKLAVTGEQDAWFLHQILTRSIEDMRPGDARDAALLTVHGRMVAYVEVLRMNDGFLLHYEPDLAATLPGEMERYVFATRVELRDVTDEYGLVLVAGPDSDRVARALDAGPVHPSQAIGQEASYVWCERDALGDLLAGLADRDVREATEQELEAVRIEHGVARWGRDMTEKTIALEANIDSRAIDFDKGCYPGQEAVAKIHFRGHVNRSLRKVMSDADLEPGMALSVEGKVIGTVTSAANGSGLAMVRHTVEAGTRAAAGQAQVTILD